MRSNIRSFLMCGLALLCLGVFTLSSQAQTAKRGRQDCRAVTFEGEVKSGEAFRKIFSPEAEFFLEPLASGWIIRVLEVRKGREVRESHDMAEVATPPYKSVSPLLISTDWAFRAQDAGAWNPREFRYASDPKIFRQMAMLEEQVNHGDRPAESAAALLVAAQPEGRLTLENVVLVPGLRDQSGLAATVASHWLQTPHQVVQGEAPTQLGRLASLRFRVQLDLPAGLQPSANLAVQHFSCDLRPTG